MMSDPWIGKMIGGCKIEHLIGRGGMGAIYLAHQLHLDRKVAVKLLLYDKLINQETKDAQIKRFQREARLAGQLQHPNAVQIYDFGYENDMYYIVMQYIDGVDVKRKLEEEGPLKLSDTLHIFKSVLKALNSAHAKGIIHRDIKPANIMIKSDESVVITDFGLAKRPVKIEKNLSDTGAFIGTLGYMSPEQAKGEQVLDHRSDIYSLGATIFHMLTGECPFSGKNPVEVIYKHVTTPAPKIQDFRSDIPLIFSRIVEKMMKLSVEERFQSCQELQDTLLNLEKKSIFGIAPKKMRKRERPRTQLIVAQVLSGEQQLGNRVKKHFGMKNINLCASKTCTKEWSLSQVSQKKLFYIMEKFGVLNVYGKHLLINLLRQD